MLRKGLILVCLLWGSSSGYGQSCVLSWKDDSMLNKRLGEPVIEGVSFTVPAMTWRFISEKAPELVTPRFQWEWVEFPYPDRPFGAWNVGEEVFECAAPSLEMTVPSHTIKPRGWYKGKYTSLPGQKPRFYQVEFKITWERDCSQTIFLSPKQLKKFQDNFAVLKRGCSGREFTFVKKKK